MFKTEPHRRWRSLAGACALSLVVLGAVGCTPRVEMRGNVPDSDLIAEIVPGETHARDVADILGAPSTVGLFEGETWYYIGERVETTAFLAPEVKERDVVLVAFNKSGLVTRVERRGLEHGQAINPIYRETPTAGNELTFFEQIIGNLGRFNKAGGAE